MLRLVINILMQDKQNDFWRKLGYSIEIDWAICTEIQFVSEKQTPFNL